MCDVLEQRCAHVSANAFLDVYRCRRSLCGRFAFDSSLGMRVPMQKIVVPHVQMLKRMCSLATSCTFSWRYCAWIQGLSQFAVNYALCFEYTWSHPPLIEMCFSGRKHALCCL